MFDFRNGDGTLSPFCANGVRCAAKWLGDRNHVEDHFEVEVRAGVKALELVRNPEGKVERVIVDMGPPSFGNSIVETVRVGASEFEVSRVSMGNPHAVMFVDDIDEVDLETVGSLIPSDTRLFPEGVNVEIATVLPAVRCVATLRGLPPPVSWPAERAPADPVTMLLRRPPTVTLPAPDPSPGAVRALVAGATEGSWRLALLPAAALPAIGLPALAGRSTVPLALGLGLALLLVGTRARRIAADRARLRRWGVEVTATVRGVLETELARRLLEVERRAGAELDDAANRRRAEVEAELRVLAPTLPAAQGVSG